LGYSNYTIVRSQALFISLLLAQLTRTASDGSNSITKLVESVRRMSIDWNNILPKSKKYQNLKSRSSNEVHRVKMIQDKRRGTIPKDFETNFLQNSQKEEYYGKKNMEAKSMESIIKGNFDITKFSVYSD
jgi:alpha-galactosidase/6-phospho-beta-glucosidase family protein